MPRMEQQEEPQKKEYNLELEKILGDDNISKEERVARFTKIIELMLEETKEKLEQHKKCFLSESGKAEALIKNAQEQIRINFEKEMKRIEEEHEKRKKEFEETKALCEQKLKDLGEIQEVISKLGDKKFKEQKEELEAEYDKLKSKYDEKWGKE